MLELNTPAQYVKGIGPRLAEVVATKGIATVEDLLYYLPFRYEDRLSLRRIGELRAGEMASVIAEVRTSALFRTKRMPLFELTVGDPVLGRENPHPISPPRSASGQAPPGEIRVGQPQPLCAVYRREFAPVAENALRQGRNNIVPLFAAVTTPPPSPVVTSPLMITGASRKPWAALRSPWLQRSSR